MEKQDKPRDKTTDTAFERPRVVIRFHEGLRLSDQSDLENYIEQKGIGPWKKLSQEFPGLKLSPVFTYLKRGDLQELTRRAMKMDPTYKPAEFDAFVYVDASPETDLVTLVKTLLSWNSVQNAYIDQGGPDPVVNPADDPRFVNQGYLDPAPDGIDAEYAWTFVGGDGAGQLRVAAEFRSDLC